MSGGNATSTELLEISPEVQQFAERLATAVRDSDMFVYHLGALVNRLNYSQSAQDKETLVQYLITESFSPPARRDVQ